MFQLVCAIKKKTYQSPYFIGEDDTLFAKQFPTMFKHMLYIQYNNTFNPYANIYFFVALSSFQQYIEPNLLG